jgi:hypothetical protein
MAEPEEESAPKILVRAPNGDFWLISKDAIPQKVHSNDPNLQPQKPELVNFITNTNDNLATLFASGNPGVKVQISVVDFD